MNEEDYIIRFIDLPTKVDGIAVADVEGFINIYINARLSDEAQKKAIEHELKHYKRGDHWRTDEPLEVIERM